MRNSLGTLTGKTIHQALRFRHNGGQALPGLVVEKVFPNYLEKMLSQLPEGVVLITGTNGKTTTTKIVTEILKANGKRVLTNQTGSNLTRGIVSSVSQHATAGGKLRQDVAVLEVDEAQARRLVERIKPRWVLALNVSRDQLDRFGEVDTIASYIGAAMQEATEGIVTNAGDPHLYGLAKGISTQKKLELKLFGAAKSLNKYFPSDYELAAVNRSVKSREKSAKISLDVELADFKGQTVIYKIGDKVYKSKPKLTGQHNFLNGAAAITLCRQLLSDTEPAKLIDQLSKVSIAFGRGETYRLKNGTLIELVLVKNPASFTQALASYGSGEEDLMIAINDNIADGRDVSWLWDVNFAPLKGRKIALTSGTRAADMALRLSYSDIKTGSIEPRLAAALRDLGRRPGKKVILSTYTAMLQLYNILSKQGEKIS